MKNKFICIIISFILVMAEGFTPQPFFTRKVSASEIGLIGSLVSDVTLWEIFGTLFASAGIIIANDDIQSGAVASGLGSSDYTLGFLESNGFIQVPEGGSSALDPEDWDWTGLEDKLSSDSSQSANIIKGVFNNANGNGSGQDPNNDENDPWYRKAVRWLKYAIDKGSFKLNQYINSNNGQIELGLASITSAIYDYFNNGVEEGIPVSNLITYPDVTGESSYANWYVINNGNRIYQKRLNVFPSNDVIFILNKVNDTIYVYSHPYNANEVINCDRYEYLPYSSTNNFTHYQKDTITYNGSGALYAGVVNGQSFIKYVGYSKNYYIANSDIDINNYKNNGILPQKNEVKSPDIMTPQGPAVETPNESWVIPTLNPSTEMEIIRQPDINNYTTWVINNPAATPEEIGSEFETTVDPYITETPSVLPTGSPDPNVSPFPNPSGLPEEWPEDWPENWPGTNDNPIVSTDPVPNFTSQPTTGQTPGILQFFPFCIPYDIVQMFKLLDNGNIREAPKISWHMTSELFGYDNLIECDMAMYDSAASVIRGLEIILFTVGLMFATKRLIWK